MHLVNRPASPRRNFHNLIWRERSMSRSSSVDVVARRGSQASGWLLSQDELIQLSGYRLAPAQKRWLDRQSIPYLQDAAGRPRVARATVDRLLGVTSTALSSIATPNNAAQVAVPNFAALKVTSAAGLSTFRPQASIAAKRAISGDRRGS